MLTKYSHDLPSSRYAVKNRAMRDTSKAVSQQNKTFQKKKRVINFVTDDDTEDDAINADIEKDL